uniref:Mediator of RNA polymerase II transcription subunit 15 n=1 Tax=Timema poppense TaxID=170557 RepID=A0A7R9CI99_TIMPO|nr:unnamed protein product [Timema poppensis]
MTSEENSWRTTTFRQSVVAKIDEAIQRSGMPTTKNSNEMENHVFQKAKTKEEYLGFVARLILHVREMNWNADDGVVMPCCGFGGNWLMSRRRRHCVQTRVGRDKKKSARLFRQRESQWKVE